MKLTAHIRKGRAGFTLIELLVVIAIIAILMGLVLVSVMRLLGSPADIKNGKEIRDIHQAVVKFTQIHELENPFTSKVLISNDPKQYLPAAQGGHSSDLGPKSAEFLRSIWNKLDPTKKSYDWSGGTISGKYAEVLEGDQCLVFFLGGIPNANPPGCRGFAKSESDPTNLNHPNKVPPLFNFESGRLFKRPGKKFFSYKDAYEGQPFAYFSSHSILNTYNDADCASLGVAPYVESTTLFKKYWNPNTFQIISAGRDQAFGPGGLWNGTSPNVPPQGQDDMSNFSGSLLGQPSS